MSSPANENKARTVSPIDLDTARHKLSLVSTLLFYIARGELDLSSAALMGMVAIVDEVAESLNQKEENKNEL